MTSAAWPELSLDDSALRKERALAHWLVNARSVLVGFSGGVDSVYLAAVAQETLGGDRVLAVVGRSASYPAAQWEAARSAARALGLRLLEVDTHEMNDSRYAANPVNRCYYCKTELWGVLGPVARTHGLAWVIDGTNADDLSDYRPGRQAALEAGVRSPLAEVGLTKAEIRARSRERDLPTWAAPSSPCLSSRIPYHTAVTPERLARIERAEAGLRALGISGDLRVRDHDDLARVELSRDQLEYWLESGRRERLRETVQGAGFARVALDLRGYRTGSLNILQQIAPADA